MSIEQIIEDLKKWMSDPSNDDRKLSINTYKKLYDIIEGKYHVNFVIFYNNQHGIPFEIYTDIDNELFLHYRQRPYVYYIYFEGNAYKGEMQLN